MAVARAPCPVSAEAASDARYIHDMLRKMLRVPVFLDSSALNDMRKLITDGVQKSDCLLLLATKSVLTRPWCLIELHEAARKNIPLVIVQLATRGFTFDSARSFTQKLESSLEKLNPGALEQLRRHHARVGSNLDELKQVLFDALDEYEKHPLIFDFQAGDRNIQAAMKDVVERMAEVTGRTITWDGEGSFKRESYRKARISRQLKTIHTGIHEGEAAPGAHSPDSWRSSSRRARHSSMRSISVRGLTSSRRASKEDTSKSDCAIFVCCSTKDAGFHALVMRSELSITLDRSCFCSGEADSILHILESCELMVVLLTRRLLTDIMALYEIALAVQNQTPIVTVMVMGGGFAYDEAATVFSDLQASMEAEQPGLGAELQQILPGDMTVAGVGETVGNTLAAIIALSWSPHASSNQQSAVIGDIIDRIPKKTTRPALPRSWPRVHPHSSIPSTLARMNSAGVCRRTTSQMCPDSGPPPHSFSGRGSSDKSMMASFVRRRTAWEGLEVGVSGSQRGSERERSLHSHSIG